MTSHRPSTSALSLFKPNRLRSGAFFKYGADTGWMAHAHLQRDGSYLISEGVIKRSYETHDLRDPIGIKKELGLPRIEVNIDVPVYHYYYTGKTEKQPDLKATLRRMDELRKEKLTAGYQIESGSARLWLLTRVMGATHQSSAPAAGA